MHHHEIFDKIMLTNSDWKGESKLRRFQVTFTPLSSTEKKITVEVVISIYSVKGVRKKKLKDLIESNMFYQRLYKGYNCNKKTTTIKRFDSYFRSVGKCFNEPLLVNSCFVESSPMASVTAITRAVKPFNCISYQSCSSIWTSWLNLLTFYLI